MSTYAEHRDYLNQTIATQAPPELLDGLSRAASRLDAVDFAARAPHVGEPAPDFSLPDHKGDDVRLSKLLLSGPVVLIFYRGAWCPYCNLQLRTFQASLSRFEERGARLVAISPQTPDRSLSMAEKNELGFPVLSDRGAVVIDRYGLAYAVDDQTRSLLEAAGNDVGAHNGQTGWALPAAATFVIDAAGLVRYAHVRGAWTERAEPEEVLAVLGELV
ncbi:MAG: AhpC/TSA family protein [Solirubrobacterales bacterium]|nr:AhpC/TSA family protein [Solirubrobacterales bacterium]